jgi:EpsI family protein
MLNFSRNIVIVVLLISCFVVYHIRHSRSAIPPKVKIDSIPLNMGQWKGKEAPLSERDYQLLETRDVLSREYTLDNGKTLYFSIVYSDQRFDSFHPPEICYAGSLGVTLLEKSVEQLTMKEEILSYNKLLMKYRDGYVLSWYWFMAGKKILSNYYLQQLYLLMKIIKGKPMQGALIRVSINLKNPPDQDELTSFVKEIYPYVKNNVS